MDKFIWTNEKRRLRDLIPWESNPRQIKKAEAARLVDSLDTFGQIETIAIDPANHILDGHQREKCWGAAKQYGPDFVVDVRVASRSLTEKEHQKLVVYLHRGSVGEWDWDMLANEFEQSDLLEWGFDAKELGMGEAKAGEEDEPPADILVGDPLWPTDNEWGIPTLDLALQAVAIEAPVVKWGTISRGKSRMPGTWHFYTDDYKFNALWSDPRPVVNTRCQMVIEPNFSTNENMPHAVVLYNVFRKRWLARFWQAHGIKIIVDLNVEPCFGDMNLLGVPQGWTAYATRWLQQYGETDIEAQYRMAQARAGKPTPLFVVVGGRQDAERACRERGWVWIREHAAEVNDGKG